VCLQSVCISVADLLALRWFGLRGSPSMVLSFIGDDIESLLGWLRRLPETGRRMREPSQISAYHNLPMRRPRWERDMPDGFLKSPYRPEKGG